jgi:RimJ/RimL family protein N-acetyltransferase
LADLPPAEVERRIAERHRLFLLRVDGVEAAYGWSASESAHIGGIEISLTVPARERYLWDFVTVPEYRGRGLYPMLLQAIIRAQLDEVDWFWIGHEPHNLASRRGILKAGFKLAGHVWRLDGGELGFVGSTGADPLVTHGAARALGLKHLHRRPNETHEATRHSS